MSSRHDSFDSLTVDQINEAAALLSPFWQERFRKDPNSEHVREAIRMAWEEHRSVRERAVDGDTWY